MAITFAMASTGSRRRRCRLALILAVLGSLGSLLPASVAVAAPGDIITVAGGPGSGPALEISMASSAIAARGSDVYIADAQVVRRVDLNTGLATVLAGTGYYGNRGDGGPAVLADLGYVYGVTLDAAGNIYVADYGSRRIRRIDAATGVISSVAGGDTCRGVEGCPAETAAILPTEVAIDSTGTVYFLDSNERVYRIDSALGTVVRVAGTFSSYSWELGDGGPATEATLSRPYAIAIDHNDNLLVADTEKARIRKVDTSTGIITTVVGDLEASDPPGEGLPATAVNPGYLYEVAVDVNGDVLFGSYSSLWRVDAATGTLARVAGGNPESAAQIGFTFALSVNELGDIFFRNGSVRRLAASDGTISAVAGSSEVGSSGDGRSALSAQLWTPGGVAADAMGNLYIADSGIARIRKVDASSGIITTIAGTGASGSGGDSGPAIAATFMNPAALAVDGIGNVYVADLGAKRVRRIDSATGLIATVAGGAPCCATGDGGPATAAHLRIPRDVALDGSGGLLIVDGGSHRVRRVDLTTGLISTAIGDGTYGLPVNGEPATEASLAGPDSVGVDRGGNILVGDGNFVYGVDAATGLIERVLSGLGTAGEVAPDGFGYVYVADTHFHRIHRLDLVRRTTQWIAGTPSLPFAPGTGFAGDGGPARLAVLRGIGDVAFDQAGNLLIADGLHNRIRRIERPPHVAGPRPDCRAASRSSIELTQGGDARQRLVWKWRQGEETPFDSLGDPIAATSYTLVVYELGGEAVVWSEILPPGASWRALGGSGFRYQRGRGAAGTRKIILRSGPSGRARVIVEGAGEDLGLRSPLDISGPVIIQLVNDHAPSQCWQALFLSSERSDATVYRASSQ